MNIRPIACSIRRLGLEAHATLARTFNEIHQATRDAVDMAFAQIGLRVNEFAPIDRLTDDVLVYMFRWFSARDKITAARTCSRWRFVLLSDCGIWSEIELFGEDKDFRQQFILMAQRAKDSLIDLTFHLCDDEKEYEDPWHQPDPEMDADDQLDGLEHLILAPELFARLRKLELISSLSCRHKRANMTLPACPNLRCLSLNWMISTLPLELAIDSAESFSSVTSLTLLWIVKCGDGQELNLRLFPNVKNLALDFSGPMCEVTFGDLLRLFPKLEALALHAFKSNFVDTDPGHYSDHRLHRLSLHGKDAQGILDRLSRFACLNLVEMEDISIHSCPAVTGIILEHMKSSSLLPGTQLSVFATYGWILHVADLHGKRRTIRTTSTEMTFAPGIIHFAVLNLHQSFFRRLATAIPDAKLPHLTTLRLDLDCMLYPFDFPISCPGLRDIELVIGGTISQTFLDMVTLKTIRNFLLDSFSDLSLPLDNILIFGKIFVEHCDELGSLAKVVQFSAWADKEWVFVTNHITGVG